MSDSTSLLENYCRQRWPLLPDHWLQKGACSCRTTRRSTSPTWRRSPTTRLHNARGGWNPCSDKELQGFIQQAVGYTLNGCFDEHCLFYLYGSGKKGKTAFTEALSVLLGEYSQLIEVEASLQSWRQAQPATSYIAQISSDGKQRLKGLRIKRRMRLNAIKCDSDPFFYLFNRIEFF